MPDGILVVYYISRPGNNGSPQYTNNWQPFPKGLRMVAGDPLRRTSSNHLYLVSLTLFKESDQIYFLK